MYKDPKLLNSKFASACKICGCKIAKGQKIVYFPANKKATCLDCGENDYNEFLLLKQDEIL